MRVIKRARSHSLCGCVVNSFGTMLRHLYSLTRQTRSPRGEFITHIAERKVFRKAFAYHLSYIYCLFIVCIVVVIIIADADLLVAGTIHDMAGWLAIYNMYK